MGRRRNEPKFRLLGLDEACRLTGLDPDELARQPDVERLERRFADGRQEAAVRLPVELLGGPNLTGPQASVST